MVQYLIIAGIYVLLSACSQPQDGSRSEQAYSAVSAALSTANVSAEFDSADDDSADPTSEAHQIESDVDSAGMGLTVFKNLKCGYWGSSTIHYTVGANFKKHFAGGLSLAIQTFSKATPIKFVEGQGSRTLQFAWSKAVGGTANCHSSGATINLGGIEAQSDGTKAAYLVHEILHSLGYAHEQQRDDRAKYVEVVKEIPKAYLRNNNDLGGSNQCDGGFDFNSIMYNFRSYYGKNPESTWMGYGPTNIASREALGYFSYADIASLWRSKYANRVLSCYPAAAPKVAKTSDSSSISLTLTHGQSPTPLGGYVVAITEAAIQTYPDCNKGVDIATNTVHKFKVLKPDTIYNLGICVYGKSLGKNKFLSRPLVASIRTAP